MELAGLLVNAQWLHRHLLMDKYRINLQAVLISDHSKERQILREDGLVVGETFRLYADFLA